MLSRPVSNGSSASAYSPPRHWPTELLSLDKFPYAFTKFLPRQAFAATAYNPSISIAGTAKRQIQINSSERPLSNQKTPSSVVVFAPA